jgi:hypothetical protein
MLSPSTIQFVLLSDVKWRILVLTVATFAALC